ncbi:trifunctional serine/threonine-protein kinase/ATP-binding protein/sensor histidine kinase [Variovorax saccharolyticus]|uniref:trifunctional serine/threonine-protein kinase/ATP-binding protein/sensor histidine kinase n=1 Tax=Variovorax saccharolyticus TaxID=3053516 RepID=UPI0025774F27|nr:AAA family ATPase [Variovorax sp. J31P216]MDM0028847.1 AAA family ATPase [Variovorax sp. J31P216]
MLGETLNLSGYTLELLRRDSEFTLLRGRATASATTSPNTVLVATPTPEQPRTDRLRMLEHEFNLRSELESRWAIRPIAMTRWQGRTALVLEDVPGEPLDRLLEAAPTGTASVLSRSGKAPMALELCLRLVAGLAGAIGEVHRRGIVHKNVKPANVLVDVSTSHVWLTGFGIASRLPRQRQVPVPPETIAGTLAYMAPEQTGRMNRSIDGRSDLYGLGIVMYEMLTGTLPFAARDPMEWVHCHVARRPPPPELRAANVPAQVSAIVLKLLAKTAEDRYQTAASLERDLRRCFAQLEREGRISSFPLGEHDIPDRLLVPEKLYGRKVETAHLLAAFERSVHGGAPEFVLVSGSAGMGKSSLVNELHKVLVPSRGLFAAGKFDQFKRDIPYATVAQAFQGLLRSLLTKSEDEFVQWRDALREALGPNGQLMVDLVPELKLIIGDQAPVPALSHQDAQRRFQLVFRRFLAVFATPEHPLALFLDDLQWLDSATLDLLEDLLAHPDARHLLLVGAYRDNEVTSSHPLRRMLDEVRKVNSSVHEVALVPLIRESVTQIVAHSLHCGQEHAVGLAELVHEKTGGNPFFVVQFLGALAEEGMVRFDPDTSRWIWDLDRIRAKGYTDNIADLMIGKLRGLPPRSLEVLQLLACLGSSAELELLSMVRDEPDAKLLDDLHEALRTDLILYSEGSYRFLHDRVQEAAYSLIPQAMRPALHLQIGRRLAQMIPQEKRDDAIFEIVNQLNRGASLIASPAERAHLAELNLVAGKRAKASTAYASALGYLVAGAEVLSDAGWDRWPYLRFALELHRAECEFLTGELSAAEGRLTALVSRAIEPMDQAAVACLRIDVYTTLNHSHRAIDICLDYLWRRGVEWSPNPTQEEARREYERMLVLLDGREIEELIDLPLMSDPQSVAMLEVLNRAVTPASLTDENLLSLLLWRMVNLSLEHGNTDASCLAYVHAARIAGARFGNDNAGLRFGRLGFDLVERRGLRRFEARTRLSYAVSVATRTSPLREVRSLIRDAFDAACAAGDLTYAAISFQHLISNLLAAGDPLTDVQLEAERGLAFAQRAGFRLVVDVIAIQLALVRMLRGLTPAFGHLDDAQCHEAQIEKRLSSSPGQAFVEFRYWTRKLQARFVGGDPRAALQASSQAWRLLWTSPSSLEAAEAHFYGALSHAAACHDASSGGRQQHVGALREHHTHLVELSRNCSESFQHRALLVGAELARVEGREREAERLYETAIRSARENGFVHNEALANELAGRFHAARDFPTIALAYLRNARWGYVRWGAGGKVRQLDQLYPQLGTEESSAFDGTIAAPTEHLDLTTLIRVSQAISREVLSENLIDTLMRSAIEHAGAQGALLLLAKGAQLRIAAEATTLSDAVSVQLVDQPADGEKLPQTVLRYVLHTQESVVLNDASATSPHSSDSYVARRQVRSVLCLPLANQSKLVGVLYLENNLAPSVFLPARIAVLKVLVSQAAISLENARLYRDLAEREARIRRLVDANIIGIFIWELAGPVLEANDAFLEMVGYEREDISTGRLRWTDLIPPEFRELARQTWAPQLLTSKTLQPFEAEYVRKDGSRVPVLIGVAIFEEPGERGVAYVLDLTERRRAHDALSQASTKLEHMSRVMSISALTASIAHEISQPLSGILVNAATGLRLLDGVPVDTEGVRMTIQRTKRDAERVSHVVDRLRALFSKRDFAPEPLNLNEAAREVLVLSASDLQRRQVVVLQELDEDLPHVMGDRIQLQQVILNLVRNAAEAMESAVGRARQLWVRTALDASRKRVTLSVRDVGEGLPSQQPEARFEAFQSTKAGGMGIGLFVSRSIVERHSGRLWAESNLDAPGATFSFTVPCAPSAAWSTPPESAAP